MKTVANPYKRFGKRRGFFRRKFPKIPGTSAGRIPRPTCKISIVFGSYGIIQVSIKRYIPLTWNDQMYHCLTYSCSNPIFNCVLTEIWRQSPFWSSIDYSGIIAQYLLEKFTTLQFFLTWCITRLKMYFFAKLLFKRSFWAFSYATGCCLFSVFVTPQGFVINAN